MGWHLQGPNFGLEFTSLLGGEVGERMKGLCLLPNPKVPGASFPRAGYPSVCLGAPGPNELHTPRPILLVNLFLF